MAKCFYNPFSGENPFHGRRIFRLSDDLGRDHKKDHRKRVRPGIGSDHAEKSVAGKERKESREQIERSGELLRKVLVPPKAVQEILKKMKQRDQSEVAVTYERLQSTVDSFRRLADLLQKDKISIKEYAIGKEMLETSLTSDGFMGKTEFEALSEWAQSASVDAGLRLEKAKTEGTVEKRRKRYEAAKGYVSGRYGLAGSLGGRSRGGSPSEDLISFFTTKKAEAEAEEAEAEEAEAEAEEAAAAEAELPAMTHSFSSYNGWKDRKISLPKGFRGEDSFEHIRKVRFLKGDYNIYEQLVALTNIRNNFTRRKIEEGGGTVEEVDAFVDNRMMWNTLRGDTTRMTLDVNGAIRNTFGMSPKKFFEWHGEMLRDQKANRMQLFEIEEFFKSLEGIRDELGRLEIDEKRAASTGADLYADIDKDRQDRYDSIEALSGLDAERRDLSALFFDPYSYGPPVQFDVFRSIHFAIKKKKRPHWSREITEDTWRSKAARGPRGRAYERFGLISTTSHQYQFDELMRSGASLEDLVDRLNTLGKIGEDLHNRVHDVDGKKRKYIYFEQLDADEIRHNPNWKPKPDTLAAVRFGAMAETQKDVAMMEAIRAESRERDPYAETASDPAKELAKQVRQAMPMSDEEFEALALDIDKGLGVGLHTLTSAGPESFTAAGALNLNIPIETKKGTFILDFAGEGGVRGMWTDLVNGDGVQPILRASTGATFVSKRFGRNERWKADVFARVGVGNGEDLVSMLVGAGLSYDLNEKQIWAFRMAIMGSLRGAAIEIGFQRDFEKDLKHFIEEFKEAHKEEIKAQKDLIAKMVSETEVPGATEQERQIQRRYYTEGYQEYFDRLMSRGIIEGWLHRGIPGVKLEKAGLTAGVSYSGGVEVGPHMSIAFFDHKVRTVYLPPLQTGMARIDFVPPTGAELVEAADTFQWASMAMRSGTTIDLPKARGMARAENARVLTELNDSQDPNARERVELTPGDPFTTLSFPNIRGKIRMFVDADSDVEMVLDGGELGINLGRGDHPIFHVREEVETFGGGRETIVFVTTNPTREMDEIVANSPTQLSWDQTSTAETGVVETSNPNTVTTPDKSKVYGIAEATTPGGARYLEPADLGLSDSAVDAMISEVASVTRTVRGTPITLSAAAASTLLSLRDAHLYRDVDSRMRAKADEVAKKLTAKGAALKKLTYYTLMSQDKKPQVDATFKAEFLAMGFAPDEITQSVLNVTHQFAMEYLRAQSAKFIPSWGKKAVEAFTGLNPIDAEIVFNSINRSSEITPGSYPEGTEYFIMGNDTDGDKLPDGVPGVYDSSIHGDVIGHTEWSWNNDAERDALITALGMNPKDPNDVRSITQIRDKILAAPWPKPFPTAASVNMENALLTMAGALLFAKPEHLNSMFGEEDADKLREMESTRNFSKYPDLAAKFAEIVRELYATGEATVTHTYKEDGKEVVLTSTIRATHKAHSGISEKCKNPAFGRSTSLSFEHSGVKEGEDTEVTEVPEFTPQSGDSTVSISTGYHRDIQGLRTGDRVKYASVRFSMNPIPQIKMKSVVIPPDEPEYPRPDWNGTTLQDPASSPAGDSAGTDTDAASEGDSDF